MTSYTVSSFYKFHPLTSPETVQEELLAAATRFDVRGLGILATEGFNFTLSAPAGQNDAFLDLLFSVCQSVPPQIKRSETASHPFRKFVIKVRDEIVTTGSSAPLRVQGDRMLTPEQWRAIVETREDIVLLDVRNRYEYELGQFAGAMNPELDQFADLDRFLEKTDLAKDATVLTYCTGGIRCEKAVELMKRHGFQDVYQLEGGILSYLEKFPNDSFRGECFVFDQRVAVTQELEPTKRYRLCWDCGNPIESVCVSCSEESR